MTNLEKARLSAVSYIDRSVAAQRRFDYLRHSPFSTAKEREAIRENMIRLMRASKVAARVCAWYETGAMFYNARDFR